MSILAEHLHPFMTCMHSHECSLFQAQQCTTTTHVHRHQILAERVFLRVWQYITWPSHSPDLNTTKYIWAAVQHATNARDPPSLNITEQSSGGMVYTVPTILPRAYGVHALLCCCSYPIGRRPYMMLNRYPSFLALTCKFTSPPCLPHSSLAHYAKWARC